MRQRLGLLLFCLALTGGGCAGAPSASSDPALNEHCLLRTDAVIEQSIALDLQTLDAKRSAAQACAARGTSSDTEALKSRYRRWLNSAASGIASGAPPAGYEGAAAQAQRMDAFLRSCPGGLHLPDCGTDVNCQRGQAVADSFDAVGKQIIHRFQGCPPETRTQAASELTIHHDWN